MAVLEQEPRPSTESTIVTPIDQPDKDLEAGSKPIALDEQTPRDPNIVDWDGPDDPANPMNWSSKRKIIIVAIVSGLTFVTYAPTMTHVPELI